MVSWLSSLLILVGIPVIRSIGGWLSVSLEDGKLTKFEYKKLFSTVVRVGLMGLFAYFGFSIAGVENSLLAGGIAAFFADKLFGIFKKKVNN